MQDMAIPRHISMEFQCQKDANPASLRRNYTSSALTHRYYPGLWLQNLDAYITGAHIPVCASDNNVG